MLFIGLPWNLKRVQISKHPIGRSKHTLNMMYQASERLRNTCCLRAAANGKQDSVVGYSSTTVIQTEEKRSPQKKIPQAIEEKIEKHVFYLHW